MEYLQDLFEEFVEQPRVRHDVDKEFENGQRVLYCTTDQVKASSRARHAEEIRALNNPSIFPESTSSSCKCCF